MSGGEDWADHPENDVRVPAGCGNRVHAWARVLRDGALGAPGEWAEGAIAVSPRELWAELGGPPGGAESVRAWESQLGRDIRGLCPGALRRRRRTGPRPAPLENAYILPRLDDCRAGLAAWVDRWESLGQTEAARSPKSRCGSTT